jgi:hypothetical protein
MNFNIHDHSEEAMSARLICLNESIRDIITAQESAAEHYPNATSSEIDALVQQVQSRATTLLDREYPRLISELESEGFEIKDSSVKASVRVYSKVPRMYLGFSVPTTQGYKRPLMPGHQAEQYSIWYDEILQDYSPASATEHSNALTSPSRMKTLHWRTDSIRSDLADAFAGTWRAKASRWNWSKAKYDEAQYDDATAKISHALVEHFTDQYLSGFPDAIDQKSDCFPAVTQVSVSTQFVDGVISARLEFCVTGGSHYIATTRVSDWMGYHDDAVVWSDPPYRCPMSKPLH